MKFKAALYYQDALVYYSIYNLGENYYKAKLDADPLLIGRAPLLLELHKQGRHWQSDCTENEIVRELGAAIEQRLLRR